MSPTTMFSDASPPTKTVVLDTSVLVADPDAIHQFDRCDVRIPLTAIEELDGLKARPDAVGQTAREALRAIEALRVSAGGSLVDPLKLAHGGTLAIVVNGVNRALLEEHHLDVAQSGNRIIGAALGLKRDGASVEVVSNDAALRIKAAHIGLAAKEFVPLPAYGRHLDSPGWQTLGGLDGALIDRLFTDRSVEVGDVAGAAELCENEFAVLRAGQQSALTRRRGVRLCLLRQHLEAFDLKPRNIEQRLALDLLLDPDVRIVALDGYAGTGKTILALAAGLEQVIEQPVYDKVAVYRPVVPVGKSELGFLPGTLAEKLDPWMQAVTDALVAMTERRSHADALCLLDELTSREKLSLETVTFLRGRSLLGTYVLVDEAQNLEPTTLKTILTRVGDGTKIVFTGDTSQIDAPYLSEHTNAIAVLIDAFAGQRLFGHVRLSHCERSEVASLAAELL